MQIQNSVLSLFNYIDNRTHAETALKQAAKTQSYQLEYEIRGLQGDIAQGNVDQTLAYLQSGEKGLSLQTLDNLLNFTLRPISQDLQQVAEDLGIRDEVEIKNLDGKWQINFPKEAETKGLVQLQN